MRTSVLGIDFEYDSQEELLRKTNEIVKNKKLSDNESTFIDKTESVTENIPVGDEDPVDPQDPLIDKSETSNESITEVDNQVGEPTDDELTDKTETTPESTTPIKKKK